MDDRSRGAAMAALAVLILSPDLLLIRLIASDPWTIVFWRSSLMTAALIGFLLLRHRTRLVDRYRSIGKPALVAVGFYGFNVHLFVIAAHLTTAANVAFLIAATPIFAALSAWVLLREATPLRTWLAIAGAIVSVGVILSENLAMGLSTGSALLGDLAAIGVALFLGAALTLFRGSKGLDTVAAVSCGSFLAAVIAMPLAQPFSIGGDQFPLIAIMGLFVAPVSFTLLTLAPRHIPSAEVGLFLLGESILAPIWIWLAISEAPSPVALIGGGMLLLVLSAHSIAALRSTRSSRLLRNRHRRRISGDF